VFHAEWVKAALASTGYRSRLYLTSTDFAPDRGLVDHLPYEPLRQDTADLMLQRLQGNRLVLEEILFFTALQIARKVAAIKGRKQTVYAVGMDFTTQRGYSGAVWHDYSTDSASAKSAKISTQEFFFINALYLLRNSELDIVHIGEKSFSTMSAGELNRRLLPPSALSDGGQVEHNVAVVAELTTNHFGDRLRLERMIRAAAAAGADFVKLQKRDVETFYTPEQLSAQYLSPFGKTFADYRHALELTADDFAFVDGLCKQLGIGWFASVLDEASYRFMRQFQPNLIKLPSTISEHRDYLRLIAQEHTGAVVLSTGMTDNEYESFILSHFSNCEQLYLLQCNSAYPTPNHDCNVGVVRHYHQLAQQHPRIVPGYSSHDLGWMASALAVAAGARMLEKHVKLGNTEWAHFDAVAVDLTSPDFKEYVARIRETEVIVGSEEKSVNASEHHKYRLPD